MVQDSAIEIDPGFDLFERLVADHEILTFIGGVIILVTLEPEIGFSTSHDFRENLWKIQAQLLEVFHHLLRLFILHVGDQSCHLLLSISLLFVLGWELLVSKTVGLVEFDTIFVVSGIILLHALVELKDLLSNFTGIDLVFSKSLKGLLVVPFDQIAHVLEIWVTLIELVDSHTEILNLIGFSAESLDKSFLILIHFFTTRLDQKLMLSLSLSYGLGLRSDLVELFELALLFRKLLDQLLDLQSDLAIFGGEDWLLRELLFLDKSLKVVLSRNISLMYELVILFDLRSDLHKIWLLFF